MIKFKQNAKCSVCRKANEVFKAMNLQIDVDYNCSQILSLQVWLQCQAAEPTDIFFK